MRRKFVIGGLAVLATVMVVLVIRSWTTDDADRARASVERFAAAVETQDYEGICRDLLADDLQDKLQAVDLPCERAMELGFGEVRRPRLTVENVVVIEDRARAAVRTDAADQLPSADVLSLEKEGGEWRISALNQTASTASTNGGAATPTTGAPSGVRTGTVVTAPTPVQGDLTPKTEGLPDDDRILDREGKGKTEAEKRRDARQRALMRRALRVQGERE